MARSKLGRSIVDICADCSAPDPGWASINKGILICDECCSIHRTLGRHVSFVKSLKKGSWIPSQLAMVHALHSNGANGIWEHTLLDPSTNKLGKRKPQPKDPIKPNKADFIRAKHQMLAFVYRPNRSGEDKDNLPAEGDVSQQLHSSVRTANLEITLRLLSLGADPNYQHPEKGTTCLHVAAAAGQASQVELLLVYGADPGALDFLLKTPSDHAREKYPDIADRLFECQFELTDRLSVFLCGRKADHASGQHYLIPEMADGVDCSTEFARVAKKKMQMLPNYLFEEIAADLYDEVDRRETETIWQSMHGPNTSVIERCNVPFLPVNPELSSTRNQSRQKLARLNARELTTLIIDILTEAKRRQTSTMLRDGRQLSTWFDSRDLKDVSDDEPLYDSVASEDDYSLVDQQRVLAEQNRLEKITSRVERVNTVSVEAYTDIKEQLLLSNRRMEALLQSNNSMQQQIGQLQQLVQSLVQENLHLKSSSQSTDKSPVENARSTSSASNGPKISPPLRNAAKFGGRPVSMFEPREGPLRTQRSANVLPAATASTGQLQQRMMSDEVIKRTNVITKRIQELFRSVQDNRHDEVLPHVERIVDAVTSMGIVFQQGTTDEVQGAINQLTSSASKLQQECRKIFREPANSTDISSMTQFIIQGAYEVAKATKHLVTFFQ